MQRAMAAYGVEQYVKRLCLLLTIGCGPKGTWNLQTEERTKECYDQVCAKRSRTQTLKSR